MIFTWITIVITSVVSSTLDVFSGNGISNFTLFFSLTGMMLTLYLDQEDKMKEILKEIRRLK